MAALGVDEPPILRAADPASIDAAIEALWAGGIVGVPTETVYGIAVVPSLENLRQLLIAKQRPTEKGIALMVDSLAQVEALADVPPAARRLAERLWPGPLTLVLAPLVDTVVELPGPLFGATGDLGFRLPDHAVPRHLAARLGPIAVTSANLSGQPDSLTVSELIAAIGGSLALVLDDGPVRGGVPSTVVAIRRGEQPRILRHGALADDAILGALR